jgi:hypothetical protein
MQTPIHNGRNVSVGEWNALAGRVLDGHRLTRDEGLAVLRADDEDSVADAG